MLNLTLGGEVSTAFVESLGNYTVTAYCSCEVCCGKWSHQKVQRTASGTVPTQGITIATSWDEFESGENLYIESIGKRFVEDKPSQHIINKYDGKIIDVYFDSHQEALKHGKQTLKVYKIQNEKENNMISIIKGESTFTAMEHNIHQQDGKYQLWITRPNGKSFKVSEDDKVEKIQELKSAIDYAIEKGEAAFRID